VVFTLLREGFEVSPPAWAEQASAAEAEKKARELCERLDFSVRVVEAPTKRSRP
jgi:hypothetical protein